MIPMRFQAYKISGGRAILKKAPSPGPPFPKNFRIWVGCSDCSSSASLTGTLKKFLVEGFGEAPSYKATPQPILISLNAHRYDTGRLGDATKYRKGLGDPTQKPRAVRMVLRTQGNPYRGGKGVRSSIPTPVTEPNLRGWRRNWLTVVQ